MANEKNRNYCLVTYGTKEEIDRYVQNPNVVNYAYILHDKDGNEPHYHVVLSYANPRSWSGVKKDVESAFNGNTMVEVCKSLAGVYAYLTHKNNADKYQYSDDDVVTNGGYYRGDFRRNNQAERNVKDDNAINIIEDILDGLTKRELLQKYGREYVINRRHYESLALDIRNEETCYVYNEEMPIKTAETKCRAVLLTEEGNLDFNPFNDEENKKERYMQNEVLCN